MYLFVTFLYIYSMEFDEYLEKIPKITRQKYKCYNSIYIFEFIHFCNINSLYNVSNCELDLYVQ